MKFEEVYTRIRGVPYIEPERAHTLYKFIIENKISDCLELGFAHGASSCYIAAALDELGSGHLTSVDLIAATEWQKPSIEELLAETKLQRYVTVAREQTSYTWFLKKNIEENTQNGNCGQIYDFCFIDGPKNWTIDGCAFFLVDKLLRQKGWILFDDLNWRYCTSGKEVLDGISLRTMGDDEINTPQIELVFRLLVMQHPEYSNFLIQDNWWAWAQKVISPSKTILFENTNQKETTWRAIRIAKKLLKKGLGSHRIFTFPMC